MPTISAPPCRTTANAFCSTRSAAHFSRIRASDLLLLDAADPQAVRGANAPDPTAWYLHAELHQRLPQARCILHTHMPHATALCCLQDFEFLMLDQNACRFHGRIAYDRDYSGMALDASEGARVAGLLDGGKSVLFMGNHGVIVVAPSVAQAFDELYYLEKAAQLQVLALSTGRPLALIPEPVAALAGASGTTIRPVFPNCISRRSRTFWISRSRTTRTEPRSTRTASAASGSAGDMVPGQGLARAVVGL